MQKYLNTGYTIEPLNILRKETICGRFPAIRNVGGSVLMFTSTSARDKVFDVLSNLVNENNVVIDIKRALKDNFDIRYGFNESCIMFYEKL